MAVKFLQLGVTFFFFFFFLNTRFFTRDNQAARGRCIFPT